VARVVWKDFEISSNLPHFPPRVYNLTHVRPIRHKDAESGLYGPNPYNNGWAHRLLWQVVVVLLDTTW
jgi:hypothetical protein